MAKTNGAADPSLRQRRTQTELQSVPSKLTKSANVVEPKMAQGKKNSNGQRKGKVAGESSSLRCNYSAWFIILQMIVCVSGIYVCFGFWSIKQERVITKPYHFYLNASSKEMVSEKISTVFAISLIQALAGAFGGFVLLLAETFFSLRSARAASPSSFSIFRFFIPSSSFRCTALSLPALMGFTNAFSSSFGFAAMRRLPYPVVLATKMSKMIPVMFVGFFFHGTRYSMLKCFACAAITCGILGFYVLEEAHESHGSAAPKPPAASSVSGWIGFVFLFFNLIADGFTNSTQDVLVKTRGWSGNRLMFWTNVSSALWLSAALLLLEAAAPLAACAFFRDSAALRDFLPLRDFSRACHFFQRCPEALRDVLALALLNAAGQFFIFRTISLFGTLTLTAVTLLRKAASVLLSIAVHGHRVAPAQWAALGVVFGGVLAEAAGHARGRRRKEA